jgi:uncharacterized protein
MPTLAETSMPSSSRGARLLRNPLVRIVLALLSIAIPFAIVATPFNLFVQDRALRAVGALLLTAVVLCAYRGYVRVVEKRAVAEFSGKQAIPELLGGLALGALLFSATIGILAALGVYQVIGSNGWQPMLAGVAGFILFGVLEEVIMRGILFRIVEQALGSWIALGLSAVIFGLLHLLNPGATLLNAVAISVEGGVMLAAAYMLTRRLWLCIGIHIAWNFTQGGIFSVAVSGGTSKGLLQAKMVGPDWLTGGSFGAEASVVAWVACAAAGVTLLVLAAKRSHVVRPFWSERALAAKRTEA